MSASSAMRVQKHRLFLKDSGLRPIQIWVPDIQAPGFVEECRRQSRLVTKIDQADKELMSFLDDALEDLDKA